MAYDSTNLVAIHDNKALGYTDWLYDTTDAPETVEAAGYIDDAADTGLDASASAIAVYGKKGMRKGDRVTVRRWSALPTTNAEQVGAPTDSPTYTATFIYRVLGISTAGAADLALEAVHVPVNAS